MAGREGAHIHLVAAQDIFVDRAVLHPFRRNRVGLPAPPRAELFQGLKREIALEDARKAHIHQHPVAFWIARDIFKQQQRRISVAQAQFVERAHFEIGIGALDDFELATLARKPDQFAQIALGGKPLFVGHGACGGHSTTTPHVIKMRSKIPTPSFLQAVFIF
jgi:hypothetical protein